MVLIMVDPLADSPALRDAGLRHNRNWLLMWFGQAVSALGDFVFTTTVVLWTGTVIAADQAWAPLAVGGVLIAAAVPIVLVGPIAGVYVDRWDRRRTMMVMDALRVVIVLALLVVPAVGDRLTVAAQLVLVYVGVALSSAAAQFFNPARFGLLGAAVEPEDQARAGALFQTSYSVAAVIGPPIAAPLLFSVGVQWAIGLNAASFAASFLALQAMRLHPAPRPDGDTDAAPAGDAVAQQAGFRQEMAEGFRFFVRSPVLRAAGTAVTIAMFGVGALNALDVFFVTDNLGVDASWLGTLGGAFGIGSVVGALIATAVATRFGAPRMFWTGMLLLGLFIIAYSRMTYLPAAIVVLALAGIPLSVVNAVSGPLVLAVTPVQMIGRVMAVLTPLMTVASMTSMAVAGWLASTLLRGFYVHLGPVALGRIDVIFTVSGLMILAGGLWASGPLRNLASSAPAAESSAPLAPPADNDPDADTARI
ncbi:MFS transporter [Micromonospora sp. MS34]|uniref:MFS transporter n=1 Tax=Micromonospora sp. MS34 TaxID=3385971 RepID=UPI0039A376D4